MTVVAPALVTSRVSMLGGVEPGDRPGAVGGPFAFFGRRERDDREEAETGEDGEGE